MIGAEPEVALVGKLMGGLVSLRRPYADSGA